MAFIKISDRFLLNTDHVSMIRYRDSPTGQGEVIAIIYGTEVEISNWMDEKDGEKYIKKLHHEIKKGDKQKC